MRRAAVAAAVAAALALTACTRDEPREPRVVVETRFLDALSKAIEGVNAARARLAADANAIGTAAAALDDLDDVAITGDRAAARARRGAAANAMPAAMRAARRLNADVAAYRTAAAALDRAPKEGLDAPQRAALSDVVSAARAEQSQLRGYATVVASVWPRYEKLDENQRLWLTRASNGWYRDQRESAGAYAVLTDRAALGTARRSLAAADARRLSAARRADTAIDTARGALASLFD